MSSYKSAPLRDLVRTSRRITRSVPTLFLACAMAGILFLSDPAHAAVTSTGNSGPGTSVASGTLFPQGTMPGAILTPIIRLDLNCEVVQSEGDAEGLKPDDSTVLMSLRLRFSGTRAKDIAAIAIAREGGDGGVTAGAEAFIAAVAPDTGLASGANEDPDGIAEREGDNDDTIGQYTPDQDAIIAYVSMARLLDPTGENVEGLDPFATSFTVSINMVDDGSGIPPYAANVSDCSYELNKDTLADLTVLNSGNVIQVNDSRFATFYVLVAPSLSLQSGSPINVALDASGDTVVVSSDAPASQDDAYVFYNWNSCGLLVGVPTPAVVAEEVEDEEKGLKAGFSYTLASAYTENLPTLRDGIAGRLVCTDIAGDQVPERTLAAGLPVQAFPPHYPPVSITGRSEDADHNIDYTIRTGRIHPDAEFFTDSYPSPEVLTSGGITYSWFGFDLAGGWIGGYDWRLSGLTVEVQGLGELGEIPRDGIDNDLDGLTDESGAEDVPQDLQMPARNDDVDFWVDLRYPLVSSATGVNGIILATTEEELSEAVMEQFDSAFGNPRSGIITNSFDKGWDPVFSILHLLDDSLGHDGNADDVYSMPPKFYRDLMIPFSSLLGRRQPELAIRFEALLEENPARAIYFASLFKIGALQSRGIDEDGDGEENSPTVLGYMIGDGVDNDEDGLVDEGIDEEAENGLDDDGDGLTDEDLNHIPLFVNADEEINNFFVDAPGGAANVYDADPNTFDTVEEGDFVFIDYNNNGVYNDGRDDTTASNLDEFQGPGSSSPLPDGDPYSPPIVFPIDDDLDMEWEDGNPLTAGVPTFDGVDNDGDGLTDEGGNEDIRDVVFDEYGESAGILPSFGIIRTAWMYEDLNDDLRLEPGIMTDMTTGGDQPLPPLDDAGHPVPYVTASRIADSPDRYRVSMSFDTSDDAPGTNIPTYTDEGDYDFFVGFQIQENMPIGLDFQVSIVPESIQLSFDSRDDFSPSYLMYPVTGSEALLTRYDELAGLSGLFLSTPAHSQAYQISKPQYSHLQMVDGLGFQSPLKVQGGYYGVPYLDSLSRPFPVLALNIADAVQETATSDEVAESETILNSIRVNFDPVLLDGGLFTPNNDLRPLGNNTFTDSETGQSFVDSGVSIYLDNKTNGEQGAFDYTDIPVPLNLETLSWNEDKSDPVALAGGYYVVLTPQAGVEIPGSDYWEIPNDLNVGNFDVNRGYDFFICVRTHEFAGARNTFRVFIRPGDISFTNGRNVQGSGVTSHTYTNNVPIFVSTDVGDLPNVIPLSDSIPVLGFNMLDANKTFSGTPARWSLVNLIFDNNPSTDTSFTTSDLRPLTNEILRNIPLDPKEDNDGDDRTFPIPDGIDNDNDGLTDEGVGNSLDFDSARYTSLSGVAIFRDMPGSDNNGLFDDPLDPNVIVPDVPVFLSGEEEFAFPVGTEPYVSVAIDHDPVSPSAPGKGDPFDPDPFETIPANELGDNLGSDYFVVLRTSKTISAGDDFRVRTGTHVTRIHNGDLLVNVVIGTSFGFMPGATTGVAPIFPNRQPYNFDPLINATLVPSILPVAQEPLSPGYLRIPGLVDFGYDSDLIQIDDTNDLYESYKRAISPLITNTEDKSDLPSLQFLVPDKAMTVTPDADLDPGTVFLRWSDIDEDSPNAVVTLVYFPIVVDPVLGEILPSGPADSRFTFTTISGAAVALGSNSDIDDYDIGPYEDKVLSDDNENVVPDTGYGTDIFTWDARTVAYGTYRVGAILNDYENPQVIAVGGKVVISNERPILVITEP